MKLKPEAELEEIRKGTKEIIDEKDLLEKLKKSHKEKKTTSS